MFLSGRLTAQCCLQELLGGAVMDTRQMTGGNPSLTPREQTPCSFILKNRGIAVLVHVLSCSLLLSLVPPGSRLLADPLVSTSASKRQVKQVEGEAAYSCKGQSRTDAVAGS